jgi:two-component system, NarL family, sensor kinase
MDASETPLYHAIVLCALVIFFFIMVFLCSSIWLQRRFRLTTLLTIEAEVMTMERERSRIAADLHDEIGPLIYEAMLKIEMAACQDGRDHLLLDGGRQLLLELDQKLREISHALVPLSLERKGLLYCMHEMVTEVNTRHPIRVELRCKHLPLMTKVQETHVYRIVQEIVLNTLKHAGASLLILDFSVVKNLLIIRTSDNGRGISTGADLRILRGRGMQNIHNRARFLKGSANLRAVRGCEWVVSVVVGEAV